MKICDFMQKVYTETENTPEYYEQTCDTLKAGDPEQELKKVAVSMFATPEIIRKVSEWGANLLIVHEPYFYEHYDDLSKLEEFPQPQQMLIKAKLELIRKAGLTIYRFHDHPHRRIPDYITEGELAYWGLKGTFARTNYWAVNEFTFAEAIPVLELARKLESALNIQRIRIFGSTKTLCRRAGLCFGTPGHLAEELQKNDVVLTGEICEWAVGELVRDYVGLMGEEKAILVMGHIGSERDGMKLFAENLGKSSTGIPVQYFECGESWSFTH